MRAPRPLPTITEETGEHDSFLQEPTMESVDPELRPFSHEEEEAVAYLASMNASETYGVIVPEYGKYDNAAGASTNSSFSLSTTAMAFSSTPQRADEADSSITERPCSGHGPKRPHTQKLPALPTHCCAAENN